MRPLIWLRSDLRVQDNPAVHQACRGATRGAVAVFLICPIQWRRHDWADCKVDFILRTLRELSDELGRLRVPLLVRTVDEFEDAPDALLELAIAHRCDVLHYNREYEVNERRRDRQVADRFERAGLDVVASTDQLILPPGSVRTGSGDFFQVFTPFKRAWAARLEESGIPKPLGTPRKQPKSVTRPDLIPDTVDGFDGTAARPDVWPAGERAARKRLARFARDSMDDYANGRDKPAVDGTSALSPYLTIGAISPRQCLVAACQRTGGKLLGDDSGPITWISELVWREFYRHVLVGYPRVSKHRPFRPHTDRIRWRDDEDQFAAWCDGRTGVPIVDAAMRQLLDIGWMHNRLRMISAMFLSKHLLLDWRWGERHFMRRLIDGDLASNNGGWQWSSSTGTDAVPYFRIFNPYRQSRRFDPEGEFIRSYLPELDGVETRALHDPAKLAAATKRSAIDYPQPIVDVDRARDRALKELARVFKGNRSGSS